MITRVTDGQTDRRTDGRTDGQTEFSSLYRVCITCSAVKTVAKHKETQDRLLLAYYERRLLS